MSGVQDMRFVMSGNTRTCPRSILWVHLFILFFWYIYYVGSSKYGIYYVESSKYEIWYVGPHMCMSTRLTLFFCILFVNGEDVLWWEFKSMGLVLLLQIWFS